MIRREEFELAQDKIELGRRCQALESDLATLRADMKRNTEVSLDLLEERDTLRAEKTELEKRLEGCREMFLTVCRERDEVRAAYEQVVKEKP